MVTLPAGILATGFIEEIKRGAEYPSSGG